MCRQAESRPAMEDGRKSFPSPRAPDRRHQPRRGQWAVDRRWPPSRTLTWLLLEIDPVRCSSPCSTVVVPANPQLPDRVQVPAPVSRDGSGRRSVRRGFPQRWRRSRARRSGRSVAVRRWARRRLEVAVPESSPMETKVPLPVLRMPVVGGDAGTQAEGGGGKTGPDVVEGHPEIRGSRGGAGIDPAGEARPSCPADRRGWSRQEARSSRSRRR